jgi:hypothetical protein
MILVSYEVDVSVSVLRCIMGGFCISNVELSGCGKIVLPAIVVDGMLEIVSSLSAYKVSLKSTSSLKLC